MPRDDIKFVLRVPRGMYGEVNRLADLEGSSLNQWILRQMGVVQDEGTEHPRSGKSKRDSSANTERTGPSNGGPSKVGGIPESISSCDRGIGVEVDEWVEQVVDHDPTICQLFKCPDCRKIAQAAQDAVNRKYKR
jgi:hypothetical protein